MQVYESLLVFIAYKVNFLFSKGLMQVSVSQRMFTFLRFLHMFLKSEVVLFSRYLLMPTPYQTLLKDGDRKGAEPGSYLVWGECGLAETTDMQHIISTRVESAMRKVSTGKTSEESL